MRALALEGTKRHKGPKRQKGPKRRKSSSFRVFYVVCVLCVLYVLSVATPLYVDTLTLKLRQAPTPAPARPFKLPAASQIPLDNGLTIVLVEDHRVPLVTIDAGVPLAPPRAAGPAALANYVALAESATELLTEGAGSLTGSELAREVESLGGRIASSVNEDYAEVSAVVVSENAPRMIEIFADVMLRPAFAQSEVALYKSGRVERLKVQRQEPAFLVDEMFDKVVYGSHPYSLSAPTPQAVRAVTRPGIERFYKSNFTPAGSVIVVVGDFDSLNTGKALRHLFEVWKTAGGRRPVSPTRFRPPVARKVYLIDRPGSEQADFRIGRLALKRADSDYFALAVADAILGAGSASRLFLNIRENKGYAYDVYSSVNALKETGTFYGNSQTRTEVTVSAIKEMLAEFDRIADEPVSERELEDAKKFLNGQFALSMSVQGGVAGRLLHSRVLGLAPDYLETRRERIDAVSADQVLEAAQKYIASRTSVVVVVGDANKLVKGLSGIGPVEVFNADGGSRKRKSK